MTKDQKNQAIELLFEVYDCGQQSKAIDLIGYLDDIVRALNIADVVGRSEQLKAFADWLQSDTANLNYDFKDLVDEYLKSL